MRFLRLKGEPHELALGMALGIFTGLMPVIPFQTAIAVTLALLFNGSKITAAIGTWISNPLNWYFLYDYTYKIGRFVLRLPNQKEIFSSIMASVHSDERILVIASKILQGGATFVTAFLVGGMLLGIVFSIPSYFIFLRLFTSVRSWRQSKKELKT